MTMAPSVAPAGAEPGAKPACSSSDVSPARFAPIFFFNLFVKPIIIELGTHPAAPSRSSAMARRKNARKKGKTDAIKVFRDRMLVRYKHVCKSSDSSRVKSLKLHVITALTRV